MGKKILSLITVFVLCAAFATASEKGSHAIMKEEMVDSHIEKAKISIDKAKSSMMGEMKTSMVKEFEIDQAHSTIGFAVRHLQVGTTRGGFDDYVGSISLDPEDLSTFKADVSINVASINTRNEGRDKHLRSPDFFDADTYSTITFTSDRLEKRGEGHVIVGDLTIRDVTKQLTIPVEFAGPVANMSGGQAIGINTQITINRQDYGVSWSKTLDNGGLAVADNVNLIIEIEAHTKS